MTEDDLVARTPGPATVASLTADLRALGLEDGDVVLVHTSLSALGWVAGGPHAVVLALLAAIGGGGTLVVPTHSGQLSDPAGWERPPVPAPWWPVIRDQAPAYDPELTPTRAMGVVPDLVRRLPGARRSDHPTVSFTAVGPQRDRLLDGHALDDGLGEGSPLARLHDLDGKVLLLGVGHGNDTSLHLAERRAAGDAGPRVAAGAPMVVDGVRRWVTWEEPATDDADFERLGDDLAGAGLERRGPVGAGVGRLAGQRDVVAFGVDWFRRHRD